MPVVSRIVRGVPLWLMCEYLEEAGGIAKTPTYVVGDGWTATLEQRDDYEIGSLRVGQVHLELTAEPVSLQRLQATLEKMLLRDGG